MKTQLDKAKREESKLSYEQGSIPTQGKPWQVAESERKISELTKQVESLERA